MGNRRRGEQAGTAAEQRPAGAVPAVRLELSAARPVDRDGGDSSPARCADAGLDAYVRHLVDAAPPLTAEQRDTLALLLRRPPRATRLLPGARPGRKAASFSAAVSGNMYLFH